MADDPRADVERALTELYAAVLNAKPGQRRYRLAQWAARKVVSLR